MGYMPGWYDLRAVDYRLLQRSVWERLPPAVQSLNRYRTED